MATFRTEQEIFSQKIGLRRLSCWSAQQQIKLPIAEIINKSTNRWSCSNRLAWCC